MTVTGVENLTIEGSSSGTTEIVTSYHRHVIQFDNCENIAIRNIKAGHTRSEWGNGEVFGFKNCKQATIENVLLYGGSAGIHIFASENLNIRESSIYECSSGIFTVLDSAYINFTNCGFFDNYGFAQIRVYHSSDVAIERCKFLRNETLTTESACFFSAARSWGIVVNNCTFNGNTFAGTFSDHFDNPGSIKFENNTMESNYWETPIVPVEKQDAIDYFIATEYQLLPPENQNFDGEFSRVYEAFREAIYNKDLNFIDSFIDERIFLSFGGHMGREGLYDLWALHENPEQSELWVELEKIIELGGTYDESEKTFIAPYTWSGSVGYHVPEGAYDSLQDGFYEYEEFIIDKEVKVYEEENAQSRVIDTLSYNVCFRPLGSDWEADFVKIKTPSGAEGYTQQKYLRTVADMRLRISYEEEDGWRLRTFIGGD